MNQETKTITPDRLTEILHKRADRRLELKIQQITNPLYRQGAWIELSGHEKNKLTPDGGGKLSIRSLVEVLHAVLVRHDTETTRSAEVKDFLSKVENTAEELDAIREEINQ
jgi:hypothetical protein